MLSIEYELSLVETTVFLAVRSDEELGRAYHHAIDPLYEIDDPEQRQHAFEPVFRSFFTSLGLDLVVGGLIAERPRVGQLLDRCVVREAARKKSESAELFIPESHDASAKRIMVIEVCPQSLIDSDRFVYRMRRELLHVSDMLDERFGYQRDSFSGPLSFQNLQRDRYRVLWDTYVAGRLQAEGLGADDEISRLEQNFSRVFVGENPAAIRAAFQDIRKSTSLTHRGLMDWAAEPNRLMGSVASPTGKIAV